MTAYGWVIVVLAAANVAAGVVTLVEVLRARMADRDDVVTLWGLWATILGRISARTATASHRAWSKVDAPSRHRWGRDDTAAVEVGVKVLEHRRLSRVGAR